MFLKFTLIPLLLLAASPVSGEKVVATVNDDILTTTELERMLQPLYRQYEQTESGRSLRKLMADARASAIENWVNKQLILQAAREIEEFQIDPMEIDKQFEETLARFPSREDFEKALAAEGLDEDEFRKNLEDQFKVKALTYQKITSTIQVPPSKIIEYFNAHSDEYQEKEQVRISHILIPALPEGEVDDKARATAADILAKIEAGDDFGELARKYSRGPFADQGGDMNYFEEGELMEPLNSAAFSLKVGEHSGLIRTDRGYHIILVTGRKEASRKSLDDLWEEIEDKLFQDRFQRAYDEWIEDLKSKAYVVVEE